MSKPYIVDLHRRYVDTVIVWAESENAAREFAQSRYVEDEDEFPTGAIFDTEIVDVEEHRETTEELQRQDNCGFGYVQHCAPWRAVQGLGSRLSDKFDRLSR